MNQSAEEEVSAVEVALYIADMAKELARLAREAGLATVAGGLEQAYRAAMSEARAQSGATNAAPEDAT